MGFSLFFFLGGDTFSPLLGHVQPPAYDLKVWDIGLGILFGIIALPLALIFLLTAKALGRLAAPLSKKPIARGALGGLLLGLLGMALPINLSLGTAGLADDPGCGRNRLRPADSDRSGQDGSFERRVVWVCLPNLQNKHRSCFGILWGFVGSFTESRD